MTLKDKILGWLRDEKKEEVIPVEEVLEEQDVVEQFEKVEE